MPKSGYSVSAYLKAQQKANSASVSVLSSKSEWTKKPPIKIPFVRTTRTGRKSLNTVQGFKQGYTTFLEIHGALKEKPVGSKHVVTRTSDKGIVRKYVYEKVSNDKYKLVSKSSEGSEK